MLGPLSRVGHPLAFTASPGCPLGLSSHAGHHLRRGNVSAHTSDEQARSGKGEVQGRGLLVSQDTKVLCWKVGLGPLQPHRHLIPPQRRQLLEAVFVCSSRSSYAQWTHFAQVRAQCSPVTHTAPSSRVIGVGMVPRHSIATCRPYGSLGVDIHGVVP